MKRLSNKTVGSVISSRKTVKKVAELRMDLALIELTLFVVALMSVYKFLIKNHKFFEKRGVKYLKPTFLVGNFLGLLTGRDNGISAFEKPYKTFKNEK